MLAKMYGLLHQSNFVHRLIFQLYCKTHVWFLPFLTRYMRIRKILDCNVPTN